MPFEGLGQKEMEKNFGQIKEVKDDGFTAGCYTDDTEII